MSCGNKDYNTGFQSVSVEEWMIVRPTNFERMNKVKDGVKELINAAGKCDKCTSWRLVVSYILVWKLNVKGCER